MATFKLIQAYNLTGSANTIVFDTIPQTYTDLCLYVTTYSTRGVASVESWQIRPNNSISGTEQTRIFSYPLSSPAFNSDGGPNELYSSWSGANASNFYNNVWIYIPNYTSTSVTKCLMVDNGTDNNSSEWMVSHSSMRTNSTSAITSLTLSGVSYNFQAGSSAYLYGISNA